MTWNPDILKQGEIHALREAAERAWGDDTRGDAYRGSPRRSAGHCYQTSRWLQTKLGGGVGRVEGHYVWLSPDQSHALDLTGDQFGQDQIIFKPTSHHLFEGVQPVDPAEYDDDKTHRFIARANREWENQGDRISKIALDYAGDAFPAQEPEKATEIDNRYWHHEKPIPEGGNRGEYKFVYANGRLEVSPFHDHEELAQHAGVTDSSAHSGPVATGYISVDVGMANWSVASNVGAKALSRVFKDYTKQVGWSWGGMVDLEGEPIGTGSEFAPKKSEFVRFAYLNDHLYIGMHPPDMMRVASRVGVDEEDFSRGIYGWLEHGEGQLIPSVKVGPNFLVSKDQGALEGLVNALRDYSHDEGLTLVAADNGHGGVGNNVVKRIEDLELKNIYSPTMDQKEQPFFPNPTDEREPSGTYKCPDCQQLLPTWRAYNLHRLDHESPGDEPNPEGGAFPEVDMDATFPTHFTEQKPEVFPVASFKEANRCDGFSVFHAAGMVDAEDRHYVAFESGCAIGFGSVSPDGELRVVAVNRPVTHHIVNRIRQDYTNLYTQGGNFSDEWLRHAQFTQTNQEMWRWSADQEATDMLEADLPFIYDVQEDNIYVGQPGTKTSEIPGAFTPGGIIEGTYEPGGKVYIRSLTTIPYSTRHLIELWYHQHPQLRVKNVIMRDEEGKETKLATQVVNHEVTNTRPTKIQGLERRNPWIYESETDTLHVGPRGTHHSDLPVGGRGCVLGYAMDDGEVHAYPDPYLAATPEIKKQGLQAARKHFGDDMTFRLGSAEVGTFVRSRVAADPAASHATKALQKAGGRVYAVGGAVRDAIRGDEPKDIDLMVTGIPGDKVQDVLEKLPGTSNYKGKDFGVFRYKSAGSEVEIAMPRRERSTGDKHTDFDVQADHTMTAEEDLYRRDFTANAMAVDLATGELVDPYGGADDITNNRLKTVHEHALAEDPLRVVRGLSAHGRFGLEPDEGTRAQMNANAASLAHLPQERIQAELDKIMESDDPAAAIKLAHETGALAYILPEVEDAMGYDQNNPHHEQELGDHLLSVLRRTAELTDDPDVRLAALLHDIGKPASAWPDPITGLNHFYKNKDGVGENHEEVGADMAKVRLQSLKYPTDRTDRVEALVRHHMFPWFESAKGARRFINKVGDHAEDLMDIREADNGGKTPKYDPRGNLPAIDKQRELIQSVREGNDPTERSMLAINGNDLVALGLEGPAIGQELNALTNLVIEDPSLNDRDTLLRMVQEQL